MMQTEDEQLRKRHKAVIDSHVFIDHDEFKNLAAFVMVNDQICGDYDIDVIKGVLEQIAVKCLGYESWLQAYHEIE